MIRNECTNATKHVANWFLRLDEAQRLVTAAEAEARLDAANDEICSEDVESHARELLASKVRQRLWYVCGCTLAPRKSIDDFPDVRQPAEWYDHEDDHVTPADRLLLPFIGEALRQGDFHDVAKLILAHFTAHQLA